MRVFVTGATGYIGNGVAKAFARAGHEVFGLVRQEAGAKELQKAEIHPLIGSMEQLPKEAMNADAIIHCAYENGDKEKIAVDSLIKIRPKTLVYTSGVWVYGNQTQTVDETSPLDPLKIAAWRPLVEQKVLSGPHRSIVIRPGHVYGYDKGLIGMIFESAAKGELEIAGDGENHWSMVHLDDLARIYVLAVEKQLNKEILNATENSSIKMKDLAMGVAALAGTQAHFLSLPNALKKFGPLAEGLAVNQTHISNQRAAKLLGWHPNHNSLISALKNYWSTWKAFT